MLATLIEVYKVLTHKLSGGLLFPSHATPSYTTSAAVIAGVIACLVAILVFIIEAMGAIPDRDISKKELGFWEFCKGHPTKNACGTYLKEYPNGAFKQLVEQELRRVEQEESSRSLALNFNSTDLQTITESMASSLLQSAPLAVKSKLQPLITIANVKNKTSEYIDTKSITDSIRTKMLKSGRVRFTEDTHTMMLAQQADELVRQNQTGLYKKSKPKKIGNMERVDFRIEGSITSIVNRSDDVKNVYYKFSLQLIDIESGIIKWADEKEIHKTSTKSMF